MTQANGTGSLSARLSNSRTEERKTAAKTEIKEVHYERVFNLGNYETCRVGLTATVGPKQTPEEIIGELDEFTLKMRNEKIRARGAR
jgi:hypothetical protein